MISDSHMGYSGLQRNICKIYFYVKTKGQVVLGHNPKIYVQHCLVEITWVEFPVTKEHNTMIMPLNCSPIS